LITFDFPSSVQFGDLNRFSREVMDIPKTSSLLFKTGHLRTFTPTSMVYLAKTCRFRARTNPKQQVKFAGLHKHDYANNLGFSEALKLVDNPFPKGAYGGETYLPLSTMRIEDLLCVVQKESCELGDAIQIECEKIAKVVSQKKSEILERMLADSFREIFRNVFEHSGAPVAGYCVQYWPSRDVVEVCIADRGMGFAKSLAEEKTLGEMTDRKALLMSLMPGISSKARANKKKKSHQKSEWDNSGFGLFSAHRLFGKFGWFGLASGQRYVFCENGSGVSDGTAFVEGSIVSLRLNLSDVDAMEREVQQIRRDAATVKERLGVNRIKMSSVEAFLQKRVVF
jgi:anti-sigma regulatory factor (Ser/Thr protein kinase)